MPSTVPYSLALVVIVLTASIAVLGQGETPEADSCLAGSTCETCVVIKISNSTVTPSSGNLTTCVWEVTSSGQLCVAKYNPSQEISNVAFNSDGCKTIPSTTTTAPPTTNATTTTETPTTTNATTTTTAVPTTNATTTVPTTLPTNATTTPATPTTNGTTPITTPIPSNSTTTALPPTPTPSKGGSGFSWGSFIGGIVFAAALSSLAYLIWRFYKVRLDRNYHTLSTNLI